MSEGNSRPWQEILKDFLCFKEGGGEDCISDGKLSASSIQKYFEPLLAWLDEQRKQLLLKSIPVIIIQEQYYGYETKWDNTAWEPVGFNDIPTEKEYKPNDQSDGFEILNLSSTLLALISFIYIN